MGNDNGVISQWFEVAQDGKRQFTQIRDFRGDGPVALLTRNISARGFISAVKMVRSTSSMPPGGQAARREDRGAAPAAVAISPRHNLLLTQQGTTSRSLTWRTITPR